MRLIGIKAVKRVICVLEKCIAKVIAVFHEKTLYIRFTDKPLPSETKSYLTEKIVMNFHNLLID